MRVYHKPLRFIARYLIILLLLASELNAAEGPLVFDGQREQRYRVDGEFDDIKALLVSTIEGRGLKISNTSFISNMLQRTMTDVGGKPIYKQAEALEFCSAVLSRSMMEADPHHIVLCPYIIYIYVNSHKKIIF